MTRVARWTPCVVALCLIAVATLLPVTGDLSAALTPPWFQAWGDFGLADAVVNVVLFVPLGWALAFAGVRPLHAIVVALATTIGVELLQYGVVPGRVASVWDVLANAGGGVVGLALPRLVRRVAESRQQALRAAALYGLLLGAGLAAGALLQAVALPRAMRWTARYSGRSGYVRFAGSLGLVRVDGSPVAADAWRDVQPRGGAELTVEIHSARPDSALAEIVQFWMPGGAGWTWVDQWDRDLRLHIASGGDRLRLRGHSPWVRAVMPALAGDSVTLRLVLRRFSYRIAVTTQGREVVREARISPADGWRLFMPFGEARERWASWLSALWMAVLVGPLGYLATLRSRAAAAVAAAGIGAYLLLLPIVLGCAALPAVGWCGAAGGLVIGFVIESYLAGRARRTPEERQEQVRHGQARI